MTEDGRLKFDSGKFSEDEFSPKERGEMRERHFHYDTHFLTVDEFIDRLGISWLVNMSKGVPAFAKMFGTVTLVGGAILVAKEMGWL